MTTVSIEDKHYFGNFTFKLDYYNCSNCSNYSNCESGPSVTPKYSYCPYCGIKLDWNLKEKSKDGVAKKGL